MSSNITQADIDALEKQLVSGDLRVRFSDGREVQYRSVQEMRAALDYAKSVVSSSSGGYSKSTFAGVARNI